MSAEPLPGHPILICDECGAWKYKSSTNTDSPCFHGGKRHLNEDLKKQGYQPWEPTWGCQGHFRDPLAPSTENDT